MRAPVRLEREMPATRQAAGATAIGALLSILGGGMLLVARIVRAGESDWLVYVVGTAFSLAGLMMLFFGIKMALITRLPQTIVEVDRMPVRAGAPFQVTVRQPGPIRLESLRLNVIGEQLTRREGWRNGRRRTYRDRRLIHQSNVVDVRDLAIARGAESTSRGEAMVPAEVTLVDIEGDKTVTWRLEVWGRVRGWVNFGHPFVIDVVGGRHRAPPEETE